MRQKLSYDWTIRPVALRLHPTPCFVLKYFALALFLSATALPALAQTNPAPNPTAAGQYQYCNLVGYGIQGRSARLEYGQHPKPAVANPEMEALDEKIKNLDSVLLALNYLTNNGWEYTGVTSLSQGDLIIYVLRRRMR